MYKSINKTNTIKTLLDDYDFDRYEKTVILSRMRRSEFVRQAVMEKCERFHAANSINNQHPQLELNQLQMKA